MAKFDTSNQHLNDMVRSSATVVKRLQYDNANNVVNDDELIMGVIPREARITTIGITVFEGFNNDDATLDLRLENVNGTNVMLSVDMKIGLNTYPTTPQGFPIHIVIPVANGYSKNPDGSVYTGNLGQLSTGKDGLVVKLRVKSVGGVTKGDVAAVIGFDFYGTKTGTYGAGSVPMTPYKQ